MSSTDSDLSPARLDPRPVALVRNVRPWGGPAADIHLQDGRITAVSPHDPSAGTTASAETTDGAVIEGRGRLALPTFSDVHVHLDSTRLGLPFRPHTGRPGVWGMMLNDRENWREAEASIERRVANTARMMIERGTTHMRAYGQVDVDAGLERLDAVLAVREALGAAADIEVVAWPQAGLLREAGASDLLDRALARGADVMGGLDPSAVDRDPVRHLDAVFGLAEKHQVPIDIHLHERGSLGAFSIELICERTRAAGMQGKVTIAHAFALGTNDEAALGPLIEQLADLDIAVTTIAPAHDGILPLTQLREAGVRVGLGEDGQRDYWSPYGTADMLDRTWQLAFTQGFRADELIENCLETATLGGRAVRDHAPLPGAGERTLRVGDPADLVLLESETLTSAVMDRPRKRTVLHRGALLHDGPPQDWSAGFNEQR